jgi:hypothetical protein
MNQMVAADGRDIAITCKNDNLQLRVGQLDARGKCNRPSVSRMDGVKVHVTSRS